MATTRSSPRHSSSVELKHVKVGYQRLLNHLLPSLLLLATLSALLLAVSLVGPHEAVALWRSLRLDPLQVISAFLAALAAAAYLVRWTRPVYLVDFSCFRPPTTCRIPFAAFLEHSRLLLEPKSVEFQMRILERSGLGEETGLPVSAHYIPPVPTLDGSRDEFRVVIFTAIDDLIRKTGLNPREDIDVLVVNCNSFYPLPSLASMVINRYGLRSSVRSYNLSGMGCSAGPISVGMARDLLRGNPDSTALVVSTEIIICPSWYMGNQRSMLIPNCLFRMGGAAVLLSNRRRDRRRAKYELLHVVRTHTGADDAAYRCLYQQEDGEGNLGISLSKEVMPISGDALRYNLTALGRLVLPLSEQLRFLFSVAARRLIDPKWKPYVPDFGKVFEHICVHAGGRAVIDEVQKNLRLSGKQVEASRMTLHRFGNTSSSSIWYELSYMESKGWIRGGERVWQLGLGSGFKCNSAVLRCLRTIETPVDGPWSDCIHRYPVDIPDLVKF